MGVLIVLVVAVLAILSIVGFQQQFFSSHLSSQVSRVNAGSTAVALADSANQEAVWLFESKVNDPASALFTLLRGEVLAPNTGALDLAEHIELEEIRDVLTRPEFKGYTIESFSAQVVYQRQFEDLPYERFGLVKFTTRVAAHPGWGPSLVREVELAKGFKVVLAVVPRPFDQAALFVGEAGSLTRAEEVNSRRRKCLDEIRQISSWLSTAATSAPAELAPRYAAALGALGDSGRLDTTVPEFDCQGRAMLVALWSGEQYFPLENLDVARVLEKDESAMAPDRERLASARQATLSTSAGEPEHRALLEAADRQLRHLSRSTGRLWAFSQGFKVISPGDGSHGELAARLNRLRLDHWRRVAFHQLVEDGRLGPVAQQFAKLREKLQPLNGVVLVEATNEPFRLSGELRGKMVIVVAGRGGVILDGVNKGDRENDLLTVVAVGGPVTIQGEVHACVVSVAESEAGMPGPVAMPADAVLRGGLILERVNPSSELKGTLHRVGKYFSGTTGRGPRQRPLVNRYLVGVSPAATYCKVLRN
jgi:hypothetical protein